MRKAPRGGCRIHTGQLHDSARMIQGLKLSRSLLSGHRRPGDTHLRETLTDTNVRVLTGHDHDAARRVDVTDQLHGGLQVDLDADLLDHDGEVVHKVWVVAEPGLQEAPE